MSIVLQTKGTAPAFFIAEAVSCLLANFLYCMICYAFLLRRYSQISAVSIIAPNPASAIPMVLLMSSIPRITLSDEGVVVGVWLTFFSFLSAYFFLPFLAPRSFSLSHHLISHKESSNGHYILYCLNECFMLNFYTFFMKPILFKSIRSLTQNANHTKVWKKSALSCALFNNLVITPDFLFLYLITLLYMA